MHGLVSLNGGVLLWGVGSPVIGVENPKQDVPRLMGSAALIGAGVDSHMWAWLLSGLTSIRIRKLI